MSTRFGWCMDGHCTSCIIEVKYYDKVYTCDCKCHETKEPEMGSAEQEFADQFYIDEETSKKMCVTHKIPLNGVVCVECKALRIASK